MERCIINKKSAKENKQIRYAQKISKKYYKRSLYSNKKHEPKAQIQKLVDISDIEMIDMTEPLQVYEKRLQLEKSKEKSQGESQYMTKAELVRICRESHLTGRSGNGFETATKIESFQKNGGVLLINGVECDPLLVHDAWIYRNCLSEVEKGVELLNQVFQFERIVLATKEPLKKPLDEETYSFEQIQMNNRFPLGYENYLIESVLNQVVPEGKRPTQIGILVLNIQTVMAIAELSLNPDASDNRYITVANSLEGIAKAVRVTSGQSIAEIVKAVYSIEKGKIYAGSGSTHCHEIEADEVVGDVANFIAIGNMPDYEHAGKCAGCGKCSRSCPAGVEVSELIHYVEKNGKSDAQKCKQFHPQKCIGCGACTYNCSAGKDTREVVAWAKNKC